MDCSTLTSGAAFGKGNPLQATRVIRTVRDARCRIFELLRGGAASEGGDDGLAGPLNSDREKSMRPRVRKTAQLGDGVAVAASFAVTHVGAS
jgi:hypothetical protein